MEAHDKFIKDKVDSLKADIKPLMDDFKTTLQLFEEDIVVFKKAMLLGTPYGFEAPSKICVLEPKGLSDNQNAKELENFLWDMD